jgi:tellurite resistance protein TerC
MSLLIFTEVASSAPEVASQVSKLPSLGFPVDTVAIFVGAFVFSLLIDLIQHKNSKEISIVNASVWSVFWIGLSFGFYGWLKYGMTVPVVEGMSAEHIRDTYASLFLTGYVLEKVLSVDNLIVFIAIFKYFNIKDVLQHKILYYGILGAIIFRAIFVGLGSLLMAAGGWAELIFGAIIAYAAFQMISGDDDDDEEEPDYERMLLVRWFNKLYPIFPRLIGNRFIVSRTEAEASLNERDAEDTPSLPAQAMRFMTPAFVCLLVIEGSDVMFAFDSVPAVIAVTKEPLLVYSAMIFAILGLRSLYFVLVALTKYLVHLEKAVLLVLFFIAFKMFVSAVEHFHHDGMISFAVPPYLHIDHNMSLWIVLGVIGMGIIASLIFPGEEEEEA